MCFASFLKENYLCCLDSGFALFLYSPGSSTSEYGEYSFFLLHVL
jgi:hypothetical protein